MSTASQRHIQSTTRVPIQRHTVQFPKPPVLAKTFWCNAITVVFYGTVPTAVVDRDVDPRCACVQRVLQQTTYCAIQRGDGCRRLDLCNDIPGKRLDRHVVRGCNISFGQVSLGCCCRRLLGDRIGMIRWVVVLEARMREHTKSSTLKYGECTDLLEMPEIVSSEPAWNGCAWHGAWHAVQESGSSPPPAAWYSSKRGPDPGADPWSRGRGPTSLGTCMPPPMKSADLSPPQRPQRPQRPLPGSAVAATLSGTQSSGVGSRESGAASNPMDETLHSETLNHAQSHSCALAVALCPVACNCRRPCLERNRLTRTCVGPIAKARVSSFPHELAQTARQRSHSSSSSSFAVFLPPRPRETS